MDTFELSGNKNAFGPVIGGVNPPAGAIASLNAFVSVWEPTPFAPRPNGERPEYVITKDAGVYGNLAATGPLTLREAEGALAKYRARDSSYHIARIGR